MQQIKQDSLNEWLVLRSQRGERDALNELLGNWQQRYFLYALNRLGETEAAHDVTQECLFGISRNLKRLKDPAAFPKWSFRILERRCMDWLRKTVRERKHVDRNVDLPEAWTNDTVEHDMNISRLLAQLEPEIRQVLRLYYLEGQSIMAIAEICQLAEGTVKSRLFYARKFLATKIDK